MWWNKKKLDEVAPIAEEITTYQQKLAEATNKMCNQIAKEFDISVEVQDKIKEEVEKQEALLKRKQQLQQKRAQRKKEREEKKLREQILADKEYIKFCMRRIMQEFPNWNAKQIIKCDLFKKYNPIIGAEYSVLSGTVGSYNMETISTYLGDYCNLSYDLLEGIYNEVIDEALKSINEEWEKRDDRS